MLRRSRLLALAGLVLIGLLYWKPLHTYAYTRGLLASREAQVSRLETQQRQLKERIATVGTGELIIALLMSSMDFIRPPGVSTSMRSA